MRRTVAVLALTVLTVTAGCSALGTTSNADGVGQAQHRAPGPATGGAQTVAASASGQIQTAPDRAIIRVAVTSRADSIETVRRQLARNVSQMRTALEGAGLAADQIVSARYDLGRNFRHDEQPSAPEFQGEHSFVVTLDRTDRAGEIVVTAVQNGATNVREVRFTITDQTRRDLRQRALARATENARAKASVMANGTALTLTDVRAVQTGAVSVQPVRRRGVTFEAAGGGGSGGGGGPPTSFEGGKVTVTAQATVVYNATTR